MGDSTLVHRFIEHVGSNAAIYTFVGVVLTGLGFGITLVMLWKTKTAAGAAKDASVATQSIISTYDLLVEVPQCIVWLNEMVRAIRKSDFELALARATDCKDKLVRLLEAEYFNEHRSERIAIRNQVQILGAVIVNLNEHLKDGRTIIDFREAVNMSSAMQTVLSGCIGKAKAKL